MRAIDFLYESAISDLANRLPSLKKHDYTTIDDLLRQVAKKHRINKKVLKHIFIKKYGPTPASWIKNKLDEDGDSKLQAEVDKFTKWACKILNIKNIPEIDLSRDTQEAQDEHHTGRHIQGENKIWVYVNNRNLVDILRTVFHELVHIRQDQLGMIQPGDSYPGSPIEVMADMLSGKYIKIYGKHNHHIFQ